MGSRALLGFLAPFWIQWCWTDSVQAFSIDEALRENKRSKSDFLLNPIRRSRERLEGVRRILEASLEDPDASIDFQDLLKAVDVATLDCVSPSIPKDGSFVAQATAFQARTGLSEVCTLKIILKSATSLLTDEEAELKASAIARMEELVRRLESLEEMLQRGVEGDKSVSTKLIPAVDASIEGTWHFENAIRACLGMVLAKV